jgi:hypothetical protein
MSEYMQLLKETVHQEVIWDRAGETGEFYHFP